MEMKNGAPRTRVFGAALALGLIIGAQAYFSFPGSTPGGVNEKAVSNTPSGEEHESPGEGAGLRPALPGISLKSSNGERIEVLKPTASQLSKAWTQSTTRLKYLDRCERSGKCVGFDDSEAWSYDLDLRRQQAAELRDFKRIALAWQEQHGGVFPEEAQVVARYFLATGNDDVKEAALDLIEAAPVTAENLRTSLVAIETSASAPLMTRFMKGKLVAACSEASYAPMCVSFIKHTMRLGGENLQRAFARRSLEITNEHTIRALVHAERQLDPRSTKRLDMRLNREEWQRMQRGG